MDFSSLVKRQTQLSQELQQFIDNCKKAPLDRRTSDFYTGKIKGLQEFGDELYHNHCQLLQLKTENQDDGYFLNKIYESAQARITDYTRNLEDKAKELLRDPAQPGDVRNVEVNVRKKLRNQRALMQEINRTIEDVMAQQRADHPPSYYTITATVLEQHMIEFAKNNDDLWETTEEDNIEEYTLAKYYETEERAKQAMIELQRHMPGEVHNEPNQPFVRSRDNALQLPKISLPKFNGDYLQWEAFKDLYTEMVHSAPISDSQRMHYLTQALLDEPKSLIQHLPATGSNYAAAWAILTNRYSNKRLIVSTLLNKLFSQQPIKSESPGTLKSLHDVTKECIHGLRTQGLPVEHWDAIVAHFIVKKMDQATQIAFEEGIDNNKRLVTQDEVLSFLERRFQCLEVRGLTERSAKRIYGSTPRTCASVTNSETNNYNCPVCKGAAHKGMYACNTFVTASLNQKWKWVKDLRLCVNCLKPGHKSDTCKSGSCTKCSKKHNTLIHNDNENRFSKTNEKPDTLSSTQGLQNSITARNDANCEPSASKVSLVANSDLNYVLLGTARIKLETLSGKWIECRAVLDSGSQVNLITEKLMKRLGRTPHPMSLSIEGVGNNETKIRHRTTIKIQSRITDFAAELEVHIIPKIVSNQPVHQLHINNWGIPQNISLADPEFNKPGKIECLLGAEIFFDLLQDGQVKLAEKLPILRNSVLGWIVAGNVDNADTNKAICGICTTKELEETVSKFWESEDIPDSNGQLTADELHCESHYLQHTIRDADGKFVVKLPLKDHPSTLSESKGIAYQRFQTLERRFEGNQSLKGQYVTFMREYESLGHMTRIDQDQIISPSYFIPHHCVLRPDSVSTKLRVVFDASACKASGLSLNDIMYNGPTVQGELFSILLRFRKLRYVTKTDVEKMYRQVWVNPEDRNLQLILRRENPNESLKTYQLNTVTYGTRAAPYLATRCLAQLADENYGRYPNGSSALRNNFYVDDGLVGADSLWEAIEIRNQLISILNSAGMKLRKWSANTPKLLQGISAEDKEVDLNFDSEEQQSTKTLGLQWLPKSDVLVMRFNMQKTEKTTKRTMSSDIAHIYDPLGLIGPVLVAGKIQLQNLWKLKIDWDADLPPEIKGKWLTYKKDLAALNNLAFPRHILMGQCSSNIQLHAFADASERAFGAAVYVRTVHQDKTIKVNLLCSKSRVAPIKIQTIPRLELCAALLASELMARVRLDLGYHDKAAYLWTDSQIVLSWIHNHPGTLPVYVAHRIVKIRRLTIPDQWRHVPSKQNPADVLSRGINPRDFASCHIWVYGPMFLFQQEALWPAPFKRELQVENVETIVALTTQQPAEDHPWIYMIASRNSFTYLQRVLGYVQRFIKNMRQSKESRPQHIQLSPFELDSSLKLIVRQIQASGFSDIIRILRKEKFVPKTNHLSSLTPFLDEEGIVRVGGRTNSSTQPFDANHQMILPGNDPLVKLLMEKVHNENYHCGPQALLATVRQRFWPLKGKSLARAVFQRCVKCTRARPTLYKQIMGNLPSSRVQPARPFLNSGVDYCGPFWVHFKTKGKRPQKAYLAVFCCFATKAVHLELVSDLTTYAFIGALKRFMGRRGHCQKLFCDNATNFVGARNQLKELDDFIYSKAAREEIMNACSTKGIEFHFVPPRSPHFGGLWEAAVKSAKHLLVKNVASTSLTYEELETVIVEIEAILNSRPLTPISSDPNDLNALTPGHMLVGEPLVANVDIHAHAPTGKLIHHWKLVSELKHKFWQRWSEEYLNELQQRHRWKGPIQNIQLNTLVIIKEENLPVRHWPLGRIVKVYKGDDGIVRVCDVKTQKGTFKRAVHRLAPLLPEDQIEEPFIPELQNPQTSDKTSSIVSMLSNRLGKIKAKQHADEPQGKKERSASHNNERC